MTRKIFQINLSALIATILFAGPVTAQTNEPQQLRPEINEPLQAARPLIAQGNYKAAMAKVDEAEAAPNKTPDEIRLISRMRAYITVKSADQH